MSDLKDEAVNAETETVEDPTEEVSAPDSAEQSDATAETSEEEVSTSDAFDYLDEEVEAPSKTQAEKDAESIANKWDTMSAEERDTKLEKLKSRPQTLDALTKLLDEGEEENLDEFKAKLKAEVRAEMHEELAPKFAESERMRFSASVDDFAQRNQLSKETLEQIKDPLGEVSKKFAKLKFDPETGAELSHQKRLKYALSESEAVQTALIEAKAGQKAKATIKAVNAKMIEGAGGSAKKDLMELSGEDFFKASDEAAKAQTGSRYVS